MTRTLPWQTPARNYHPLPKVLCRLGLSPGEIAVYSFLMYCENRTTYQCYRVLYAADDIQGCHPQRC